VKITDYSRSTPGLWLGTAANANAIGGVSFSSNSPALPGSIPVSISSNMLVWRDALSFGSNTNDVSSVGTMGSSPSNTRADHVHRGVHSIVAASSNTLYGDVTLVAGTGMDITVAGQNVTLASSGGSSISIGSNSTDVSGSTALGGLTTYAPSTHLHRGVHSLSHTSNTFYGDVTLVAGAGVGITVPVPGSFALNTTGGGGGGGGSGTVTTVKDEGSTLSTAVASLDFVGAGVTATGTTAVTVTIPGGAGATMYHDTTTRTVTNTTTETDVFPAQSITGGTLGNTGSIRIQLIAALNHGIAAVCTLRVYHGSTVIATVACQAGTVAAFKDSVIHSLICNLGAQNSQHYEMDVIGSETATVVYRRYGSGTAAADTSATGDFKITAQWDAANAGLAYTQYAALVEILV
jgi:hypothetical protein